MIDTYKLLDHGYCKLIESWGSDERIIEAARMSTNKGFQGWGTPENPGDERLLRYLWTNGHLSPFEMAGLIIEVQAPIFVFREWMRHRAASYNEMSARYTPLPALDYIPTVERLMQSGGKNKQSGTIPGAPPLTLKAAEKMRSSLVQMYTAQQGLYDAYLEMGVPKELARIHLPVGRYSRMRTSANLRNWLHFVSLRSDDTAQYEIRVYADYIGKLIQLLFPRAWGLFAESVGK